MRRSVGWVFVIAWAAPRTALAGMPSLMLSDVARLRVQTISFFLLVLLLCAWGVRAIWNGLRRDFPRLPKLSFGKAVGLVALWGTLFVLVLTMISGARELMTPGAWKKQGLTYRLAEEETPKPSPDAVLEAARRDRLEALRRALWQFADSHDGRFPAAGEETAIAEATWETPDPSGMRYLYVAGQKADTGSTVLAYEPGLYGPTRLALLTDGAVRFMSLAEIRQALGGGAP